MSPFTNSRQALPDPTGARGAARLAPPAAPDDSSLASDVVLGGGTSEAVFFPVPARGHMPFVGHRNCAEWEKCDPATENHRRGGDGAVSGRLNHGSHSHVGGGK